MSTTLAAIAPTLDKLIRRLGSSHDGERLATVHAIERVLKTAGRDWHDLADAIVAPPLVPARPNGDWESLVRFCSNHARFLNGRERDFVNTLAFTKADGVVACDRHALARGGGMSALPLPSDVLACDLLSAATARVRPLLIGQQPTKVRIRILWSAAKKARNLGATDVVQREFMTLAVEANLIDRRGYWTGDDIRPDRRPFGAQDVAHVITWALRGWNPFETGPLT